MPANLTTLSLSEVYPSFLHFATSASGNEQRVYDGIGNGTSLYLSTTSTSIQGVINLNNVRFNVDAVTPSNNHILVWNSGSPPALNFRSIIDVLSEQNIGVGQTGVYSAPVVAIRNGIVSNIYSTGGYKVFHMPSRFATQTSPSNNTLISKINWIGPVTGDRADVIQKIYTDETKTTLQDIKYYSFEYNGTYWTGPEIN